MKINKVVETDEGKLHFEGELSPEETDLVIECGLNYLVREGALPLLINKENLMPSSGELQ